MSIQFQDLPVAGSVGLTDQIAVDQNGVTRRSTIAAVVANAPAPAPAGSPDALIVHLTAGGAATFDGTSFNNWVGVTDRTSADAHWDQTSKTIIFDTEAYYNVTIIAEVATSGGADWPGTGSSTKSTMFGTILPGAAGIIQETQYAKNPADVDTLDPDRMRMAAWSDTFQYQAVLPDSIQPNLYALFYSGGAGVGAVFRAVVTVVKIGT